MKVTRRTIGEMSNDARILYNYIRTRFFKDGVDEISYAELSAAIGGKNVQTTARGLLETARKNIQREHHIYVETIRCVGIKRSLEVVGLLDSKIKHIRRTTRRTNRIAVDVVTHNEFNKEQMINIFARLSGLGAMERMSSNESVRKLEGAVNAVQPAELPTTDTLRLFSNGNKKAK